MISIWYRYEGKPPEVIDRASTRRDAAYLLREYLLAYGVLPGQHRHGKDRLWAGRKDEEPRG